MRTPHSSASIWAFSESAFRRLFLPALKFPKTNQVLHHRTLYLLLYRSCRVLPHRSAVLPLAPADKAPPWLLAVQPLVKMRDKLKAKIVPALLFLFFVHDVISFSYLQNVLSQHFLSAHTLHPCFLAKSSAMFFVVLLSHPQDVFLPLRSSRPYTVISFPQSQRQSKIRWPTAVDAS